MNKNLLYLSELVKSGEIDDIKDNGIIINRVEIIKNTMELIDRKSVV